MRHILKTLPALAGFVSLAGCGFLPTTGPSSGAVQEQARNDPANISLVMVTPTIAAQLADLESENTKKIIDETLASLNSAVSDTPVLLLPGDVVSLTLWTTPITTMSDGINAGQAALSKTSLGNYTVDESGHLVLPYAGTINVSGELIAAAEHDISSRYSSLGQFNQAQVSLSMQTNNRQYVIVTGSANDPEIINWQTGGLTLSEAITKAGSYKEFGNAVNGQDLKTNSVTIERAGLKYQLPMEMALESDIQLIPGDSIILGHRETTKLQCLGGGWGKDISQSYDYTPSLAQVVADGGGLSLNVAKGEAVYILANDHKTIYQIPWDTLAGLRASQQFPVENGDIVYISTSPIVTIQQITSMLFSAAYPVATATNF